jgi:crotonobetainyl-CoA:carnitine CoA-transferase CaiB-like acyl-CoA transferase
MSGACDGLRVIDFSTWMAGPLATMVLADHGADVIKIEPPGGDPARVLPAFQTWNRGKMSIVLDLKTAEGRARALELLAAADAAVVSFRPGVAERLGVGYEEVRTRNPRLVYASITGYGEDGARSALKGYEALVSAKAGRMAAFERIADRDGPVFPAVPVASFAAAMFAVQGILAALHHRETCGLGQKVAVSLLASLMPYDMAMWIQPQVAAIDAQTASRAAEKGVYNRPGSLSVRPIGGAGDGDATHGRRYDPQRVHRPGFRVPRPNYMTAVTKDGVWLQFANTADHLWLAQMQALGLVELYGDARFAKMPSVATESDSEALWALVLERVRQRTYAEWRAIFDEHTDVAVDRLLTPLEAIEHRQVWHNGHIVQVEGLEGQPTLQPGPLVRSSANGAGAGRRAPRLGEHATMVFGSPAPAAAGAAGSAPPPPSAEGPLAGVTVLDFATFFAAPYSTVILANLGARVIKVETLGGDYSRYSAGGLLAFPTTQGKQSIALDLKQPAGLAIAHRLIERADMLLHNFRPGVPERLGIDYETCRELNPAIVYLYGASYGDSGPDASRPAFHPIAGAIAGNALRQVGAGHPIENSHDLPIGELKREAWRLLRANESNPDVNAAIAAATALMLGLYARDGDPSRSGQALMTTMIASNMYANSDELIQYDGRPPSRAADEALLGLGPLYRLYETVEGWVFLACLRRPEWEAFCRAAGRPDLTSCWETGWSSGHATSDLATELERLLRARPASAWERLATEHDVPLVAVETRNPGQFCLEDDDVRRQGYMVPVHSPVYGGYWRHGSPQQFSAHELHYGPWEPVGGHTRQILAELGYTDGEVERLVADRVVEVWSPEATS